MKQKAPVTLAYGGGQPNKKTEGLLLARQFTGEPSFRSLDIVSYTQPFFRDFYSRSGLLEYEAKALANPYKAPDHQKLIELARGTKLSKSELDCVTDGFHAVLRVDSIRNDAYFRADEPWPGGGTGLGKSVISAKEKIEVAVRFVLASQFLWDALLFKKIKGIQDEHFGLLITNVVRNAERQNKYTGRAYAPDATVNYIGPFNGKAIVQYCDGFFNQKEAQTMRFSNGILAKGDCSKCLGGLAEIAANLPESCYFEAIKSRDSFVKGPIWTIVQYWPAKIPEIQVPSDEKSIICKTPWAVGNVKSITRGANPTLNIYPAKDPVFQERNKSGIERCIKYNSEHEGYLFMADLFQANQLKQFPLGMYSNCSGMVLFSSSIENAALSHANGLVRELGIPILFVKDRKDFDNVEMQASGRLQIFAAEFDKEGGVSTEVPASEPKAQANGKKSIFSRLLRL